MSFSRPPTLPKRAARPPRSFSLPPWLIFLIAIALVFGLYYLWLGTRDFLSTGGLGAEQATQQAVVQATSTERARPTDDPNAPVFGITPNPTQTELPPCTEFVVIVDRGVVRGQPTTRGNIVSQLVRGDTVCVVGQVENSDWYIIDTNPLTRRLDEAYMRNDVIEAAQPTATPSNTLTPAPSVTAMPSFTPSATPTITRTPTLDPNITRTPRPTPTDTPLPTHSVGSV
jgi:hypothetical protein